MRKVVKDRERLQKIAKKYEILQKIVNDYKRLYEIVTDGKRLWKIRKDPGPFCQRQGWLAQLDEGLYGMAWCQKVRQLESSWKQGKYLKHEMMVFTSFTPA